MLQLALHIATRYLPLPGLGHSLGLHLLSCKLLRHLELLRLFLLNGAVSQLELTLVPNLNLKIEVSLSVLSHLELLHEFGASM